MCFILLKPFAHGNTADSFLTRPREDYELAPSRHGAEPFKTADVYIGLRYLHEKVLYRIEVSARNSEKVLSEPNLKRKEPNLKRKNNHPNPNLHCYC